MRLVFLGPPGAGKGTQADLLSQEKGLPHVSPGEMFRKAVKDGSPLGLKVKEYMDRGQLVPDSVTVGIIRDRILLPDCSGGFILDGFPRNLNQAEELESMMTGAGLVLNGVVNIEVPLEILVERSVGRRVCKGCGATYHVKHNPPRRAGVCDNCGGALSQRDDDREETVKKRLAVYTEQTEPLIGFYERRGLLLGVNGNQAVEKVTLEILKAVAPLEKTLT